MVHGLTHLFVVPVARVGTLALTLTGSLTKPHHLKHCARESPILDRPPGGLRPRPPKAVAQMRFQSCSYPEHRHLLAHDSTHAHAGTAIITSTAQIGG
jgi:hypothetical protein